MHGATIRFIVVEWEAYDESLGFITVETLFT